MRMEFLRRTAQQLYWETLVKKQVSLQACLQVTLTKTLRRVWKRPIRPSESEAVTSGNVMQKTWQSQALLPRVRLRRTCEHDRNGQTISHCFYTDWVITLPSMAASLSLGHVGKHGRVNSPPASRK